MADQTVKISNFPDSGSPERVALDLMDRITYRAKQGEYQSKQDIINLYVDCLWATKSLDRNGGN